MANLKQIIAAQIVFFSGFVLFSYGGVLAGLNMDWPSMVFFCYIVVFSSHMYIGFMLDIKIDTCFGQLQDIVTKQSKSASMEKLKTGRYLDLFMIFFSAVMLLLSILARQRPLMLCIILVTVTITNYISKGVVFALKFKAHSKRTEELICKTTDNAGSKKLLAE